MPAAMGASRIPEINANGVHPECNVGVAAIVKPKEIAVVIVIAVMLKMVIRLYLQVDAGDDAGINHPDVVDVAAVPVAEVATQGNYYHCDILTSLTAIYLVNDLPLIYTWAKSFSKWRKVIVLEYHMTRLFHLRMSY